MKKVYIKLICFSFILCLISMDLFGQSAGRIYKDDCYSGSSQLLYPGSYKKSNLSFGNDKISSVYKYGTSHYIRLYEHDNYQGEYRDVYYHMNDLHSIDFEDETSSIRVLNSYTVLPTSNEEVISANIVNANAIDYVSGKNFYLPKNKVSYNSRIHMQGLGRNDANTRTVLTGCVASGPTSGCTGKSYIFLFDNNGNFKDVFIPQRVNGETWGESHPSSTQMIGNVFPVAVAEETGQYGPSIIKFYTADNDDIAVISGSQSITVSNHIGTLAYANINGYTYLIGGTWNSTRLYIWRAYGENKTSGFTLIGNNIYAPGKIVAKASIDENWGAYNSFWLGKMKEDGRVVLFATHGPIGIRSYADVWEVKNINNPSYLYLSKIHKRWKDRSTTNRPYFLEGTYPVHRPGNTPQILAFPDDFKSISSYYLRSTLFTLEYKQNCSGSNNITIDDGPVQAENDKAVSSDLLAENLKLSIRPNPVSHTEITVSLEGLGDFSLLTGLEIHDANGQLVKQLNATDWQISGSGKINVADLTSGVYTISAVTRSGRLISELFVKL